MSVVVFCTDIHCCGRRLRELEQSASMVPLWLSSFYFVGVVLMTVRISALVCLHADDDIGTYILWYHNLRWLGFHKWGVWKLLERFSDALLVS